jgi:hypothetical protein
MKLRWLRVGLLGGCLAALPVLAVAQVPDASDIERMQRIMEAKKARTSNLRRLEAGRDTFLGEMVNSWMDTARARGYDVEAWKKDVTSALARLPRKDLLDARAAGSYEGFLSRLTGRNAPDAGSSAPGVRPMTLGDEAEDLVYNEVAPCRIFDTRLGGAGYGFLTPNTPRNYSHNLNLALQGGNGAGCGIPTDPAAIAITLTVTQVGGPGNIRAWRLLDPVPNASVVNYQVYDVANTTILPTCQICGNDFTVRADVSGTHLIGDVVGYFWKPTGHIYAVVENDASFDAARTVGWASVTRPAVGVYCLTPSDPAVSPANRNMQVTVDWGKSVSGQNGLAESRIAGLGCPAGTFEVRTFLATTGAATNNLGFHVSLP